MLIIENKNETIDILDEYGDKKTFYPNFDLNKSKELLSKFNNIKTKDGKNIYELWKYEGYYLFPALQEWLYWDYFVHIVKHKEARNYIENKKYKFKKFNYYRVAGLERIHNLLNWDKRYSLLEKIGFNILNYIARKLSKIEQVILVDDGEGGFRYKDLKKILQNIVSYSRVSSINKYSLFGDKKSLYLGYKKVFYRDNQIDFDYTKIEFLHDYIPEKEFYNLIESIDYRIQDIMANAKVLNKYLKDKNIKTIITYDQIEGILPLILVAKKFNIKTYGYQHGVIMKHHAGWMGFDIPKKYCNLVPDKLVVWGEYWKEKLLKYSNKYNEQNIIVGTKPNGIVSIKSEFKKVNNTTKTILFPYEFLADNIMLSNYINELINIGFKVIVKLRPKGAYGDGDMDSDLFAYNENIRGKVEFRYDISEDEIINNIDIVGCTHSTYAYEMMQYNKPIWYFKTGLTFLEDIVEDKIAYLINEEVIKELKDRNIFMNYLKPLYSQNKIKEVFGNKDLETFVVEELIK